MIATFVTDPVAAMAFAGALALILFAAAWHKFSEPLMFEAALQAYKILPDAPASLLARLLPWAEAAIGMGLLLPATRRVSLLLFAVLIAVYAVAMTVNLLRGRTQIDCGCGAEVHLLSWALVARNALLALVALAFCREVSARATDWLDAVSLIAGVLALYFIYLLSDELLRQHGRIAHMRRQQGRIAVAPGAAA